MDYMTWLEEECNGEGTVLLDILEEDDGKILELFETGSITARVNGKEVVFQLTVVE